MDKALTTIAEFLVRYGAMEGYEAIIQTHRQLGYDLESEHQVTWRALLAVLRAELAAPGTKINYTFVFERLLQLYVRLPTDICRGFFATALFRHLFIERFASAVGHYDADVFKLESDILCHTDNIYSVSMLINEMLFGDEESSVLGAFLGEYRRVFDDAEPKAAWERFRQKHRIAEVTFRRDMIRVLWQFEDRLFGKTTLEGLLSISDDMALTADSDGQSHRAIIPRRMIESKFPGTSEEWRDLANVLPVPGVISHASSAGTDEHEASDGSDVVGETPPGAEVEERVWSARLPLPAAAAGTDSSSDSEADANIDNVVRQETPKENRMRPRAASISSTPQTPPRPRHRASPAKQRSPGAPRQVSPKRPRPKELSQPQPKRTHVNRIEPRGQADDDGFLSSPEVAQSVQDDDDNGSERGSGLMINRQRRGRKFWSKAEVDALITGLKRYAKEQNVWVLIKQAYPEVLRDRTNVDLKDKYRNLVRTKRIPALAS